MIYRKLVIICTLLIICSCTKPVISNTDNFTYYSSFKDIPGVTQDEINAIETLKNQRSSFIVGMARGTEAFYAPDSENTVNGFSALLCEWMTELFGITFIPKIYKFNELLAGINSYEIDFTGSLTITPERLERFFMVDHITEHTIKYYRLKDSEHLSEITMPKFAMLRDSVVIDFVYSGLGHGTFEAIFIDDLDLAHDLLVNGVIDALIDENDAEGVFIEYDDIETSDFLPVYLIPIALSTLNPELAPVISIMQKAIDNNGAGYLKHLNDIGYNDFRRAVLYSRLTQEERSFIQNNKIIPYVTQYRNYPMSFYNEREHEWQGIAFDLLDEIEEITGLTFKRYHGDEFINWPNLLSIVESGDAAFVTELIRTPERRNRFIWLDTTLASVYLTLASRTDQRAIHLSEVKNHNVGVVKNAAQTEVFKRWFPNHEKTIEFSDTQEAFSALEKREVDLVMTDTGNLLIMTNYLELTGFKANIVFDEYSQNSSFGLNKDQEILRSIMDKALSLVDIYTITENWKNRTFDYRYKLIEAQRPWLFGASVLLLFIIVLLLILFHRKKSEGIRLDNLVQIRTAELKEANAAKSKFLATMSHEIRTPMNVILGVTDSMLSTEVLSQNTKEAFNKIFDSGHLLLNIINDILDLSKIESGKFELIPVKYEMSSLINDSVNMNVVRIGTKQIQFKLHVDENIPLYLIGDELRIKQILNNLLSNAFKYTNKGEINLSFSIEHSVKPFTEGSTAIIIIKVSDTGQGMSSEQLSKLFDEYARFNTKANRTILGTGLGMPITRNLVKLMNGDIRVESTPNEGSIFTVHIPQEVASSTLIGKKAAQDLENFNISDLNRERKINIVRELMPYGKVLVVDDTPTNLDVAKLLMSPYQLQIETAGSGQEALEKISSGKIYDVVFMDHMMPVMDGMETTKKIRELGYKNTIVALTANAVTGQKELFLENGFDNFISKPIDIRQMNDILNKYVRRKDYSENVIKIENKTETSSEVSEFNIPGININAGLSLYGRNKKIYLSILQTFANNALNTINKLRNVTAENLNVYSLNVHSLKSICASIGAEKLQEEAAKLEAASKIGNFEEVFAENDLLVTEAEKLVSEIKEWLAKHPDF